MATFVGIAVTGLLAARWRPAQNVHTLEEWGLGGRAFGNWVTFFLLSGDVFTAYTFVALPTLVFGLGGIGFGMTYFAIAFPMVFVLLARFWSVSHVHGFVTPAEFVRARFGSRSLAAGIAITGIVATMPYIALQLVAIEAVFTVMGLPRGLPLTIAFAVLALFTFVSGLRAPALISIVKDALVVWTVLTVLLIVFTRDGGWATVTKAADTRFNASPNPIDGLFLLPDNYLQYVTSAMGAAVALFLYPHTLTAALAAKNRSTLRRNLAVMPLYSLTLGILALAGLVAILDGVRPLDGDGNTVLPLWFDKAFPDWAAALAYSAIAVGAMVPAAIMSIAVANLFTRDVYRVYIKPDATPGQETRVSRIVSLGAKIGAVLVILLIDTQFAFDLQLIGGGFILQTLPAVAFGLYTAWFHRYALFAGLVAGLVTCLALLYDVPQLGGPDGRTVVREHFGGSAWPLSNLGIDTNASVYVGFIALAINLIVIVVGTPLLRALGVKDGTDKTDARDYYADEGDERVRRLTDLLDGESESEGHPSGQHSWSGRATY
ncbi:sodium:solute symporter family protein [Virgisporangium aliadipatigenens]|nr:sodium:solute symporter [Virgisporangium aliadipatigenens]